MSTDKEIIYSASHKAIPYGVVPDGVLEACKDRLRDCPVRSWNEDDEVDLLEDKERIE